MEAEVLHILMSTICPHLSQAELQLFFEQRKAKHCSAFETDIIEENAALIIGLEMAFVMMSTIIPSDPLTNESLVSILSTTIALAPILTFKFANKPVSSIVPWSEIVGVYPLGKFPT